MAIYRKRKTPKTPVQPSRLGQAATGIEVAALSKRLPASPPGMIGRAMTGPERRKMKRGLRRMARRPGY